MTVLRRPDTPENAAAMVQAAVQAHGGLHGVIAASGMNHVAPITAMDVADFQRVQDANVRGSWLVCQAAGRQLIEQGQGGSVVLVFFTRGRPLATRRAARLLRVEGRRGPAGQVPGGGVGSRRDPGQRDRADRPQVRAHRLDVRR